MGEFPYDCEECGGAYNRCGAYHYHEYHECDSDCESDCDEGEEKECKGGQFCWEPEVVCVVTEVHIGNPSAKSANGVKKIKVGDVLYGGYNGVGHVEYIDEYHDLVVCVDPDSLYSENYVLAKVWCSSCYKGPF